MQSFRRLPVAQRRLIFILVFIGILMGLVLITLLLAGQALNPDQRVLSQALVPEVTVRQFAALPDDDAYPAAVAVAPDGTVYTGSYASGAVWAIDSAGNVRELPGARDAIGAVTGLAVAADGSILVVDQEDTDPRSAGGSIQRVAPDGAVSLFATIDDQRGFISPNDIVVDASGAVYVSDPGRNEIWRFMPVETGSAEGDVWWVPPAETEGTRNSITGLAYDAGRHAIIVTDPEVNKVYRVSIADGSVETLYQHGNRENPPGFDGATVAPDGTVYVAALGQNGIAIVDDGDLDYIAGLFRGASDVEYAEPNRLYVTNFDQTSIIVPLVHPQLPFALDVIELNALEATQASD
jgi:sugar lactone lactonase YvrE